MGNNMLGECSKMVLLVLIPVLFAVFRTTEACNGYTLKVNSIKNCVDNSVIKIADPGVTLDSDCKLTMTGCMEIAGFKTAKGKYTIKKAPMPPIENEVDFCELSSNTQNAQLDAMAKAYDMPRNCPIPQTKVCGDPGKKIDISKYKNQLGLAAGNIQVKIEAEHDTGNSCVEADVTLSKPPRARG